MTDAVYRDADRSHLDTFVQHVQIAETMATEYAGLVDGAPREIEGASDEQLDDYKRRVAFAWEGGWDQLQQACKIAAALGRDMSAFDAARARAGDLYLGVAEFAVTGTRRLVGPGHRYARLLTWAFRSAAPLRDAVLAVRAAVPEVVIPAPRPDEAPVDLRPRSKLPWLLAAIAAAIGGYFAMH